METLTQERLIRHFRHLTKQLKHSKGEILNAPRCDCFFLMKVFLPRRGKLSARLFGEPDKINADSLVYDITVPVTCILDLPPEVDGTKYQEAEVRLDFIRIGLVDWRTLPGRTFTFPVNPVAGYVDGSVYFDEAHQYADLTKLKFEDLIASTLHASVTITFHFYKNSALPTLPEILTVDWDLELDVNGEELNLVFGNAKSIEHHVEKK
jgi:hypothetical protein